MKFVSCEIILKLIEIEAKHAAYILSSCAVEMNVKNGDDLTLSAVIIFTRLNESVKFETKLEYNKKYDFDSITKQVQESCKNAVKELIDKTY